MSGWSGTREIFLPRVISKHNATRQELFPTTAFLASDGQLQDYVTHLKESGALFSQADSLPTFCWS
jgi:hypothetical protein